MTVKTMMRFSSLSQEKMRRRRKFKVAVSVEAVEGLPPALPGAGAAAAVEFEWRRRLPVVVGALSFLVGRKRAERGITSRRMVEAGLEFAAARWGDDDEASRFENVCRFRESDLVAGPIVGFDSGRAWNVSFSVLYGNSDDGVKAKELERIGTATANLVEWVRESLSHETGERAAGKKELKKQLPIILKTDSLSSYGMLYVTVIFIEVSPDSVTRSASVNAEKTKMERTERQIERSNSGSSDRGNTDDDDDILAVESNQNHTASSSGRTSPESESTSKGWFSWRKKIKSSVSYRDLEGENKRTSLSQELFFSDNIKEASLKVSSQEDIDPIGRWTSEEFMSRDKQTKLKAQTFFASIDQRDPTAGGESACTAIVAVIANALHKNELNTPTRSEFDALIREGSSEWQKLCNNKSYIEQFPNKHFDLETILEAKTRPISILHDKSFIGFFQPESFKSLHGLMSFNDVWAEIVNDIGTDSKVYIVSWNDHFFILKLETDAYYIMDTLGERLHEGCQQAYILRFDDTTEMYRCCEENKGTEDNEEIICRGRDCCKEYINRFLAAIPLQEELELEKKGIETNTALHQRLQIEFHLTEASMSWQPFEL
ncbi:uncharacterized protein LOC122012628 [Zingiber officinale]|uniref:C2 NT-type domain-containing protein n=1 Tax=Zingiber officinale TaxID=94328 RepID=A0A8J5FDG8_ZINOF|nr:uncharacterized protein LOC122012628 [Zingiber officinale]KAG6485157.1 hypothetical protein ZIOFF_053686 [Zingiber officinale]